MRTLLAPLILVSCGSIDSDDTPGVKYPGLKEQIERIEPLLLFCEGTPAFSRKNNVTGQPMCDVGDSMSTLGRTLLDGNIGDFAAVEKSIDADGRPWRHPSYVGKDKSDSFSRDQYIGIMEASYASKNFAPLKRLQTYIKRTGLLCPDATDGRCDVTPSVATLAKDVLGEKVSALERQADETTILAEAHTVPPTFAAFLVARKLMLHYRTNTATKEYEATAKVLVNRFPKSLFIRTVHALYSTRDFKPIAKDLVTCMKTWQTTGNDWWGNAIESGCGSSQGSELVSLGIFLSRE